MPKIDVFNTQREKVGQIDLDEGVFGADVKEHLWYAAVRWQLARRRSGNHSTKGRAEVSGGGKKPWRQKGTGRARQGSIRSPQWKGGGIVFGPKPRDYSYKLNKKVVAAALRGALTRRLQENAIVVLDSLTLPGIKTKHVLDFMGRFELGEALVVVGRQDDVLSKSARNLQSVTVMPAEGLNVYDVLNHRALVLTRDAVDAVVTRLATGR